VDFGYTSAANELDYYLVMTGPAAPAASSRGGVRPWRIDNVYLFDAHQLLADQRARGVKIGIASSVPQSRWLASVMSSRVWRFGYHLMLTVLPCSLPIRSCAAPAGTIVEDFDATPGANEMVPSAIRPWTAVEARIQPDSTGQERGQRRLDDLYVCAGQPVFSQVVAGTGFEPV
jgi:hypothetical protein